MKIEKITMLITAKTYPTISSRYNETVCTAGITTDWLFRRLYPICYRSLPKSISDIFIFLIFESSFHCTNSEH